VGEERREGKRICSQPKAARRENGTKKMILKKMRNK
jgi:hypothetical protein